MQRRWALYGASTIAFPFMLLAGFLMHPDLLSFEVTTTAAQLAANFHRSALFHYGHLIVALAVFPIIVTHVAIAERTRGRGASLAFWGAVVGVFGAVILALDKGALCLVLSAFDALPEAQFEKLMPALQTIVDRRGLLWLTWLLPLLPAGAILQTVGLLREGQVPRAQGIAMIVGLALLNNPDLELISSAGAILMIAGYVPLGIRMLRAPAPRA
jgi:hypothetical protein